ncbi:hypothetical protein BJV77DRAFT_1084863 [Russula vinacea]|nr:hypothetical protein BJV77DRAFT_1084863 [Russula vinacea]
MPARSSSDYSSSPRTPSPLNPNSQSPSPTPTPPSRTSLLPTPPPTADRVRLHSFTGRDPSPVRNALIPMSRATSAPSSIPQSSPLPVALSSSSPPTIVVGSPRSTTPSLFRARSPSQPEEDTTTPASTWWSQRIHPPRPWAEPSKRKRTVPPQQAEAYVHTRSRAIDAIGSVLGTVAAIGHEALFIGVDLLSFVPVPGLDIAAQTLLRIWDAVEMVEMNRLASLRLTERCADILISVREEITDAGYTVAEELHAPIAKLNEAFAEVLYFLTKMGHRPFLKRYLKRDEILSSIASCDAVLSDALGMFGLSIQIRTLKIIQANESHHKIVQKTLHALKAAQNVQDRAHDFADLRQLMRTALAANDDAAMIEVLQIARSEMPEAIKTMQRALEHVVEDGRIEADESSFTLASASSQEHSFEEVRVQQPSANSGSGGSGDTLDREFIETGIDALRRLSGGTDLGLPSWTITRYEVDLEAKVGFGFFSDVYRGTWRQHTVAIKVLADTTPRKIFVHEVEIWKKLYHPNVIELLGASSATGDPPWFLGKPRKYMKGLNDAEYARVDALRMIHEISKGMAYLHKEGVLHGDLKAANILVDDDTRCVISDFGQSEMKSEVYRISRAPVPHGTLRWQAPELMQGAQALTPEMDVYAFAICCVEILTKGSLPWPLADDDAVWRFVLNENKRPPLPPSSLSGGPLMNIIRSSWDPLPSNRPSFEQIARDIKKMRAERLNTFPAGDSPKPGRILDQWEAQNPHRPHHSPDMLPQCLPDGGPPAMPVNNLHITEESAGRTGSALGLDFGTSVLNAPVEMEKTDPSATGPTRSSSTSSDTLTSSASIVSPSVLATSYIAPLDDIAARYQDERRYRMLLQHDFHTILTLPLWRPSRVELGAVGFISKPEGRFETLFNAFNPEATSAGGKADELPMLSGYGKVLQGNQRQDKRNAAQRGFDRVQGMFSSGQTVGRTHSFQLRAGHKVAYIYAETTIFRYISNLDVPKKWFQSNIDHIMKIYGKEQRLTREDIFLVIGALDAPDYASFVSHGHPDGQVNFNVFSPARVGRAWGEFTLTSAEQGLQPSSETDQQALMVGAVTANNVSLVKGSSEPWDSVLLARLRFKPDSPEPTSL